MTCYSVKRWMHECLVHSMVNFFAVDYLLRRNFEGYCREFDGISSITARPQIKSSKPSIPINIPAANTKCLTQNVNKWWWLNKDKRLRDMLNDITANKWTKQLDYDFKHRLCTYSGAYDNFFGLHYLVACWKWEDTKSS